MTATAEQLRKFRTQGFQDGYHGRERRWSNPVYVQAHKRGARERRRFYEGERAQRD
jgi:hypothetical protein